MRGNGGGGSGKVADNGEWEDCRKRTVEAGRSRRSEVDLILSSGGKRDPLISSLMAGATGRGHRGQP